MKTSFRKKAENRMKKLFVTVLALMMLLCALPIQAEDAETGKTVRVGYYPEAGMMDGASEGAIKSGLCYEFLMELASHAGWKIEYVYGTFSDLYQMLLHGEIDMLPYITYSEERSHLMLFPDREMGEERFYIASMSSVPLSPDLHELEGKRVGTTRDAFQNIPFRALIKEKGITCELVEYDSPEFRWNALASGEVDFSIETSTAFQTIDLHAVYELGESYPFYLAIAWGREDLLAETNAAQALIEELQPGFLDTLMIKYFSGIPLFKEIPAEGRAWLETHDCIRIGTYNNDSPYVIENGDGTISGIAPDQISTMLHAIGVDIPIIWVMYPGREEAVAALYAGEIDCINPYYHNYSDAESDGLIISRTVYGSRFSVLYRGQYTDETLSRIATPVTRLGASYVRDNYPGAVIVPCQDGFDCIDKLSSGEATCVVMYSDALLEIAGHYGSHYRTKDLEAVCDVCFAALPQNSGLICIIDKAVPFLTDVTRNAIQNKYHIDTAQGGIVEFFKDYPECLYGLIGIVFIVVLALAYSRRKRDRAHSRELQKALDAAGDEQRRNDALHEIIHSGKWSFTVGADDTILKADISDEAMRLIGNDLSETGYVWTEVLHPEDKEASVAAFNAAIRDHSGQTPYDVTYRMADRNGEYHWFHSAGRVIRNADGTGEFFGIHIDITDQIEEQLEQKKQLEEALSMAQSANRAKTTFLNNMSHDIRTPMNAIIGFTGLAESHIDNKDQVMDYLSKISQSSSHLLSLINDVLDMSRIESGKMNLDEKPENLPAIIHTVRDIVQADVRNKQHDFYIDTVNVNDEDIVCDKLRLNQVLLNILSNSIKYTPQGGTISLRITEKEVKPNGYAVYEFRIRDNGMGMDEAFLKTLFDPFTRVKSSTVSGIQGTGLGMAITKNIIDMMGGRIDVSSTPGKGTETAVTFSFKLTDPHREPVRLPELSGLKCLVADDDANTAFSIHTMLKDAGLQAEWCSSGKEAVFRAESSLGAGDAFRAFFIDFFMPDLNGIEVARRLRRIIGSEAPIFILTAYDWADIEEEAHEAGVTAFIHKPLFPSDLRKMLMNSLVRQEKEPEAEPDYNFAGKKLLLVEDNELNREIATELLSEEGFIIDTAEDGDVAVEKLRTAAEGAYDLVLMDIQMPRMDGYEATRHIRALGTPLSRIPIIAMTANAFEEDRRLALEAGMNEHVAKPIEVDKLKETLALFLK